MSLNYLSEENLGFFLKERFPKGTWIRDKSVPDSNSRSRPDYRNDHYKLIVEFNGPAHYTSAERIVADENKNNLFSKLGYTIIEIPYFIQLTDATISSLFKDFEISKKSFLYYPQGFVSKECPLPAEFCELGIIRFKNEMSCFSEDVKAEILQSLLIKIKEKEESKLVVPPSLQSLLKGLEISDEALAAKINVIGQELGILYTSWSCMDFLPDTLNFSKKAFSGKYRLGIYGIKKEEKLSNPTYGDIWKAIERIYALANRAEHRYIENISVDETFGDKNIHVFLGS